MKQYREKAVRHVWLFAILLIVGSAIAACVTDQIQLMTGDGVVAGNLIQASVKYGIAAFFFFLMIRWGLSFGARPGRKRRGLGLLWGAPFLIGIAENLALLKLAPAASIHLNIAAILAVFLLAFATACVEEAGMRGVLFPLLCERWREKPGGMWKAALMGAAIFGLVHISWLIRAMFSSGGAGADAVIRCGYQMVSAFCAGMLFTGIAVYSGSLAPAIVWHGLIDLSAYLYQGVMSEMAYLLYLQKGTWVDVLRQAGILNGLKGQNLYYAVCAVTNLLYLITGIILIQKGEKQQQ